MKRIYLDNAATTMVDPKAVKAMEPYYAKRYGNASSLHLEGQEARAAIDESRAKLAKLIGADEEEIIFTSGGTESNNIAIKGIAFANKSKGNHIITTKIEHDCVLNACKWLETQGFEVTYIDVDEKGFVDPNNLEKAMKKETILVSIIHGNNEIGTIQDLKKLGEICKKHNVYFHSDACQSFTKTELNVKKINIDLVTINAHKIHGPKGVGALYVKKRTIISPLFHGGGQELGIRSGTENIAGIVGFGEAAKLAVNRNHAGHMAKLRDKLIDGLLEIPATKLNGPAGSKRLCNNVNISFAYIEGESLGAILDARGIATSTGSACSSKSLEPSHVLMALGMDVELAHGSLRLSVSRFTTEKEIDYALKEIGKAAERLRKMSPLTKLMKK